MKYTWDPKKASSNFKKHKVDFAAVEAVFEDDKCLYFRDNSQDYGEERYVAIGMDALLNVVVVVYTYRGEDEIRIISARKATQKERKQYGQ